LSCPETCAEKETLSPAVMVLVAGLTVTEVTVVVVFPPVPPPLGEPPPQPAMVKVVKATLRHANSPSANDNDERCKDCLLRIISS
jgi:hypothetical protein